MNSRTLGADLRVLGLAVQRNVTPEQIFLIWMLCKQPWTVPIPGS